MMKSNAIDMKEHVSQILNLFDVSRRPLSDVVSHYFRNEPSIGSTLRRDVTAAVYNIVRFKRRIDAYLRTENLDITADSRLANLEKALCAAPSSMSKAEYHSYPDHIYDRMDEETAIFMNGEAEVVIRVNTLKTDIPTLKKALLNIDIETHETKYSPFGLMINKRIPLVGLPAYKSGLFEVQEEASQLVALLCATNPKWHILDACAGEGGKTLALSGLMRDKGSIVAFDADRDKLRTLKGRVKRMGSKNIHVADSFSELREAKDGFDLVLLDVPCSGLGTLRRHPDLRWRWSTADIKSMQRRQMDIVAKFLPMVRNGGFLVYATCSIMKEENEDVASWIKKKFAFKQLSAMATLGRWGQHLNDAVDSEGYLHTGAKCGMDGFFGALFQRLE